MKNRVKSVFFEVINSSATTTCSINNVKITLHYSVYMRTSGEKVHISDEAERVQSISYSHIRSLSAGEDPARKFSGGGAIPAIFRSQVSLRVHYSKRDEVFFTTLLRQNNGLQDDLISRMLFSELYKIMVSKITFAGLKRPIAPGSTPDC